jgi:orotate phosphoribosyltransferase-like protein
VPRRRDPALERQALALREKGLTFGTIAIRMRMSKTHVQRLVARGLVQRDERDAVLQGREVRRA